MNVSKASLRLIALCCALFSLYLPLTLAGQVSIHVAPQDIKIPDLFHSWSLIQTDHKNFIEEQYDPLLDISQTQFGSMHYQSPDLLEQRYQKPLQGSIIFTPTTIKVNFPNRKLVLPVENFPELALFSQTILNLLNGDLEKLSKHFKLTLLSAKKHNWSLILTPINQLKNRLRSIQIDGTESTIESILFTQLSGDWRKLTLGSSSIENLSSK
jgi:hypothetical protein